MTIILFIFVLLVCVLVHEWGHYIVAKKSGMLVEEFGFGIPPRLWSFKRGETKYSINALPIGGFVKIAGENGTEANVPYERQFESKSWYIKSLVLLAGVIMNFVLAVVLFTAAYAIGLPGITPKGTPTVISVVEDSAVAEAGIVVGDVVTGVLIEGENVSVLDTEGIRTAIQGSTGPVILSYIHKGAPTTATLIPKEGNSGRMIGVSIEPIGTIRESFFSALSHGFTQSVQLVGDIFQTIGRLLSDLFTGKGSVAGLMGPVGLAREVGTAATFGVTYLLAFIATISLNLAVLNVLPFPALDGGRLIVVWGETITRRKFSPTVVGIIHTVGFLLLILLMVVLTVGDIRKVL
jgi:regulator of sigma E protease